MQIRVWDDLSVKNPEIVKKAFEELGLDVDVEGTSYGSFRELVIRANGKAIRFSSAPTVSRQKPQTVEKHVVEGTVRGLKVCEMFDDFKTAYDRKSTLEEGLAESDSTLSIEKRDVELQ